MCSVNQFVLNNSSQMQLLQKRLRKNASEEQNIKSESLEEIKTSKCGNEQQSDANKKAKSVLNRLFWR